MADLAKRTHCYIQSPRVYDIAGCPVDPDHATTWSEYEKYLWCFICEKDFIPAHYGIFDGPIPLGAARLLGISFDRINLATGQVEKFKEEN